MLSAHSLISSSESMPQSRCLLFLARARPLLGADDWCPAVVLGSTTSYCAAFRKRCGRRRSGDQSLRDSPQGETVRREMAAAKGEGFFADSLGEYFVDRL